MGGKKKYIEMFGSFTEPFNCIIPVYLVLPNITTVLMSTEKPGNL